MALERVQKVIARAGIASRRAAEDLITAGRVRVNGKIITRLGTKVDPIRDKVEVDGRRVVSEKPVYYILHKPRAVMSTMSDPEDRKTVKELLRRVKERVYPVGRLDFNTSGALLMTNDGELTEALLRPAMSVPKLYAVKFAGDINEDELSLLRNGVTLDDGYVTRPTDARVQRVEDGHTWVHITLREGKNRQIIRMGEAIGNRVMRLVRMSFAGIKTEGLRPGQYRPLKQRELERLKKNFVTPYRRRKANAARTEAEGFDYDDDADY